jgi:hypothetical protein
MSKDKKRRKKIINSTATELPKKAVALHALPRPRDRYRGRRVHPPTAHTPIPPNQKIAIFDSSIITIKTPIKT